ncbi:MAG: hypothetical protein GYA55_04590 [SAR324 cluster bacterium]|uniref:Uncharacterized protein n=1 Tax=SAR324 cluster bacterium TaxID=2024889 RepID=A0A7X9FRC0_9DELT|nr:hypothetical protein [SAR324 cluster bacterium]
MVDVELPPCSSWESSRDLNHIYNAGIKNIVANQMRTLSFYLKEFGFEDPEKHIACLDQEKVREVYKRRWNLQSPAFFTEFIKNNDYDVASALEFLSNGITSSHRFDAYCRLVVDKIPPPGLEIYSSEFPQGLLGCQLLRPTGAAHRQVTVEWYFIPSIGKLLPLSYIIEGQRIEGLLRCTLDAQSKIRHVSFKSSRSVFKALYDAYGALTVYSLAAPSGRICLAPDVSKRLNGHFRVPEDDLFQATIGANGVPIELRVGDGSVVKSLQILERRDQKGVVVEILDSALQFNGAKLRKFAAENGPLWLRSTEVPRNSRRAIPQYVEVPSGCDAKEVAILLDAQGRPEFLQAGRQGYYLKRVELRNKKTEISKVLLAKVSAIYPEQIRKALAQISHPGESVVVTRLPVRENARKDARIIYVAGLELNIPDVYGRSLRNGPIAATHAEVIIEEKAFPPNYIWASLGQYRAKASCQSGESSFRGNVRILLEATSPGYYSALGREVAITEGRIRCFGNELFIPASLVKRYGLKERRVVARPSIDSNGLRCIERLIAISDQNRPRIEIEIVREDGVPSAFRIFEGKDLLSEFELVSVRSHGKLLWCQRKAPSYSKLLELASNSVLEIDTKSTINAEVFLGGFRFELPAACKNERLKILFRASDEPIQEIEVKAINVKDGANHIEIMPSYKLFPIWREAKIVGYRTKNGSEILFCLARHEGGALQTFRRGQNALWALKSNEFTGVLSYVPVPKKHRFSFESFIPRMVPETTAPFMGILITRGKPSEIYFHERDDDKLFDQMVYQVADLPIVYDMRQSGYYSEISPWASHLTREYKRRVRLYKQHNGGKVPTDECLSQWFSKEQMAAIREELRNRYQPSHDRLSEDGGENYLARSISGNIDLNDGLTRQFTELLEEDDVFDSSRGRVVRAIQQLAEITGLSMSTIFEMLNQQLLLKGIDLNELLLHE